MGQVDRCECVLTQPLGRALCTQLLCSDTIGLSPDELDRWVLMVMGWVRRWCVLTQAVQPVS